MKKFLPHIIITLIATGLLLLVATGNYQKRRHLDNRVTLRKADKIPYGTYVAFKSLGYLFPDAKIYSDRHEPGYWDSLSTYENEQAVFIVTGRFSADEFEMKRLVSFAEKGNDVFISAIELSASAENILGCEAATAYMPSFFGATEAEYGDTLELKLKSLPGNKLVSYQYPGRYMYGYFSSIDTVTTDILGTDAAGRPDFIHLQAGDGNIFIHLVPLAFTNYFLLHKNNIAYYEKAFSYINPSVKKIVWDEYYLNKKYNDNNEENKKGWFRVLMNLQNEEGKKPFKAAFWLAIFLLLIYVLMEMRRKQRFIPVQTKPRNDSLDFVKTIGRLYFDKGDHRNLCRKMGSYFLEYVRNKYKLPTNNLNDEFITHLHYKSGLDEAEVRRIVTFIKYTEDSPSVSQSELAEFHELLETFYKKA